MARRMFGLKRAHGSIRKTWFAAVRFRPREPCIVVVSALKANTGSRSTDRLQGNQHDPRILAAQSWHRPNRDGEFVDNFPPLLLRNRPAEADKRDP
jgi:hypothetical protein